jgi:hypothetical protein
LSSAYFTIDSLVVGNRRLQGSLPSEPQFQAKNIIEYRQRGGHSNDLPQGIGWRRIPDALTAHSRRKNLRLSEPSAADRHPEKFVVHPCRIYLSFGAQSWRGVWKTKGGTWFIPPPPWRGIDLKAFFATRAGRRASASKGRWMASEPENAENVPVTPLA